MHIFTPQEYNVLVNKYQGDYKKVLCVCAIGCLRSPTVARVLQEKYGYNTRSCGLDVKNAIVPFTIKLAFWADEIVCMESYMVHEIEDQLSRVGFNRDIVCLDLSDDYDYMQQDLCDAILMEYKVSGI